MKIVITGASGFIGSNLIDLFSIDKKFDFVPLTRDIESKYFTDYSIESLKKWFDKADIVVHLAAKRGSGGDFFQYEDNIALAQNVAEVCKNQNVSKLICISSISVYSNQNLLPWHEEQPTSPQNIYGLSKLVSEELCRLVLKGTSTKLVVLRLAHVYGANEKNNYMINLFIRKAYNKQIIHVTNVTMNKREFIYVKDVANAIISACIANFDEEYTVMNAGTNDILTNQQVAKIINDSFDNAQLIVDPISHRRPLEQSYMKCEKIKQLTGFDPSYDMSAAMKDIQNIMRSGNNDVPIFY